MTNMICRQQQSTGTIRIPASEHSNTNDAAKQQLHKQLSSPIRCRFDFHLLSVSLLSFDLKIFFPADSFF